jgi:gamma-glutamyltranspeptidase / glutathione hydrolase
LNVREAQSQVVDRCQARSVVASLYGVVAAESPLAAQAGAAVLSAGGNAVDAAVAANAVMGVVAPHSNGIGGDLFAIVYEATHNAFHGLNASGWAPSGMSVDSLAKKDITAMPWDGIHSVTIPGTVDGWDKLLRQFGRMTFADLLASAITYAEDGFPVTELSAERWSAGERAVRSGKNGARTFLPNGRTPRFGEVFKNHDLAWSLQEISAGGRAAFYEGEIARRTIELSRQENGWLTPADLAEFSSEWVAPISTSYRGWTAYQLPPNGQGIGALAMLNLMEQFPLRDLGHNSAGALHIMIEAKKLAYADILKYVADPRFSAVPISEILDKGYAKRRSRLINMAKANCEVAHGFPVPPGADTIYLSVADREGNMVSLIQSNFGFFGSGLAAEGTGFVLQNRGNLFSLDRSHPNVLEGRKRPLHTIIPAFVARDDVKIAFGIMGGWNQAQAHAQFVSNIVDHDMNIQSALEAARFTKLTFAGCDVQMEARIAPEIRNELTSRGHRIEVLGTYSDTVGGGQAVMRNFSTGVNYGASDPRKDGAAIPEACPSPKLSRASD